MDWDPFNKAVDQAKSYIQQYNSPANKAVRNNPYYRQQQQLKAQMQDRLQGVTDPVQRSSIQSQYRQRIGGALQRAKSMGYSPSGNYNQNNLQKYYGQNGSNVQQLAAKNDQNFIKNVGQSMAGATYKAAVDTPLVLANLANTAYAAGNYLYGNGRFQGHQGLSDFLDKARRWDNLVNKDRQLSTYDVADQLQGTIPDWQKGIQQAAAGAAIAGLPKAVSATGIRASKLGAQGVRASRTQTRNILNAAKTQNKLRLQQLARQAKPTVFDKGRQVINNIGQAKKQWTAFRNSANASRNSDAIMRRAMRAFQKRNRGVQFTNTKRFLQDPKAGVKDVLRSTWQNTKDRFWHPLENTKQWWKYNDTVNAIRHPLKTMGNIIGNPQDAYRYVQQGNSVLDKAKRLGTVGLDAGKTAVKWGADATLAQGGRMFLDDTFQKWKQNIYADNTLTQQQKAAKLNGIQALHRGSKYAASYLLLKKDKILNGIAGSRLPLRTRYALYNVADKIPATPMSRLVGGTMSAQALWQPGVQTLASVAVAGKTGHSPIRALLPYAPQSKANPVQLSKMYALRYGDTDRFNHGWQRMFGDIGQGVIYNKFGIVPTLAAQAATTSLTGKGLNPFADMDQNNITRIKYQVQPQAAQVAVINKQLNQLNNNTHLTNQQKAQMSKPLQQMKQRVQQNIGQKGQLLNKGRFGNAVLSYLRGQPISQADEYAALVQGKLNVPMGWMLRPAVDKQMDRTVFAMKTLADKIKVQQDPAKKKQLTQQYWNIATSRNPHVTVAALNLDDPNKAVAGAMKRNNVTSGDLVNMAQASAAANQAHRDQVENMSLAQMQADQLATQGGAWHFGDMLQQAVKNGDPRAFGQLGQDALTLTNMYGSAAKNTPAGQRIKKGFQSNMVGMIKKDPSLIPLAIGLFFGGNGMPGLGNFIAQNPVLAIGGVAALFALPSLIGGLRDSFNNQGKAAPQAVAQSQPQIDLYASTLRRRG